MSPSNNSLICDCVALPPKPSRIFRTNADRIALELVLDCRQIVRFPREKMFRRNHGEIFGRVLQLHRVALFSLKIDHDLIEEKIPLRHPPEPPAFVQTKGARLKFSNCSAACAVSFPDSTSFCSSASIQRVG